MLHEPGAHTLRILVDWACNLRCEYCCNEQPQVAAGIVPIRSLHDIMWESYRTVCITGGEPLLSPLRVQAVCDRAAGRLLVLYTNGLLLTRERARELSDWGIGAINVGLHLPDTFDHLIPAVTEVTAGLPLTVRFHAWERYEQDLAARYPDAAFRFWVMDNCDPPGEDRVIWLRP